MCRAYSPSWDREGPEEVVIQGWSVCGVRREFRLISERVLRRLRHIVLYGKKLVRSVISACADRDHSAVERPRSSGPNVTLSQVGTLELLIGNQVRETEWGCVPSYKYQRHGEVLCSQAASYSPVRGWGSGGRALHCQGRAEVHGCEGM